MRRMHRQERGVVGFYTRSLAHSWGTRARAAVGRDRSYRIGDHTAVLPPGHKLPWFQAVFPTYDRYAAPVLRTLTRGAERPLLVDVGANVGDTALLAVSAVPGIRVRAVEGNPAFARYLARNVAGLDDVEVVDRFVGVASRRSARYTTDGSTGGFRAGTDGDQLAAAEQVSVEELLRDADDHDMVIWKSDTDGLDFTILREAWQQIDQVSSVIWFEFDPFLDIDSGAGLPELLELIGKSGRIMHVVDNTGRSMFTVPADVAPTVLGGLTRWLQRSAVPGDTGYLDVWLVDRELAHLDGDTGEWHLGRS
jgi:FkbM family methyltransferase